jgi:glycosyltransferase involved in cell wall biosynthesis
LAKRFASVLIDTYNHERFIEKAIVSVLEQDFPAAEREILVVDDGSADRTPECKGEMVAFLDGDDWWAPGKLHRVAEVFAKEDAVGLVGHGIIESFADGTERIIAPEKDERLALDSLPAAHVFRLRKSYLGTSRMALRAKLLARILPVPEALVIEADEYLFTLAAAMSEIIILARARWETVRFSRTRAIRR